LAVLPSVIGDGGKQCRSEFGGHLVWTASTQHAGANVDLEVSVVGPNDLHPTVGGDPFSSDPGYVLEVAFELAHGAFLVGGVEGHRVVGDALRARVRVGGDLFQGQAGAAELDEGVRVALIGGYENGGEDLVVDLL
jgi:hypothetical protein